MSFFVFFSSFLQQNLEGLDMDTEKKSLVSREIRSFRDTYRVRWIPFELIVWNVILCSCGFVLFEVDLIFCLFKTWVFVYLLCIGY